MDRQTPTSPTQELPPIQSVVEVRPVHEISQQLIDVQRFEPYSIASSIHSMFEEAENNPAEYEYWNTAYSTEEYPHDTDAFRMYMTEVHRQLKESDAVKDLRRAVETGQDITKDMIKAVFSAYERVVSAAAEKLRSTLLPQQITKLRSAGRENLDWSYRSLLLERLTQQSDAPARYALEDFFLILNPKARKVQYMERPEILKTLRYSMARGTKDQLQHDVKLARQFTHLDMAGETVTDDDLELFETKPN